MYRVFLERAAEKISRAFLRKALGKNPRPPGCRKLTGTVNDWRIRVGILSEVCGSWHYREEALDIA